jgi:hypothetical protein
MDDIQYLIFDLVSDYLKGQKTCINFRLVSKECNKLSSKLFRRHKSAYSLNKLLILELGFDKYFTLEDLYDFGYTDVFKTISYDCFHKHHSPLYIELLTQKDICNPINNTIGRLRFLIRRRLIRKHSILFNMALDYAGPPIRIEFLKEKYLL